MHGEQRAEACDLGGNAGLRERAPHICAQVVTPRVQLIDGFRSQELQGGCSRNQPDRIGVMAAWVGNGETALRRIEERHDIAPATKGSEGESTANEFAEDGQVWRDSKVFLSSTE